MFFSQGECRHLFESTRGHIILSVDPGLQGGLYLIECIDDVSTRQICYLKYLTKYQPGRNLEDI